MMDTVTDTVQVRAFVIDHCDGGAYFRSRTETHDRQALIGWLEGEGIPVDMVPREHVEIDHACERFHVRLHAYRPDGTRLIHPRDNRVMLTERYTQDWRMPPPDPIEVD